MMKPEEAREVMKHGAALNVIPLQCCALCNRQIGVMSYVTGFGPDHVLIVHRLGTLTDLQN